MEGYLYCFSNESMEGIIKIGMTERTPDIRLNEANISDTWRPPTPYKLELAKKVLNPKQKEKIIHKLLTQYSERINPNREFFKISIEEVKVFFEIMDGEYWIESSNQDKGEKYDLDDEYIEEYNETEDKISIVKNTRDIKKIFKNGQNIRHTIGINKTWVGIYDSVNNTIICNGIIYKGRSPLNQFACSHYKTERPDRTSRCNAWLECECEINGNWISTYNL
jgi:hypothetical protein